MDEKTRTISLRAIAQNKDNLLKPGMFVKIEFTSAVSDTPSMQIPNDAIIEHEGKSFVFISLGDGRFERRNVLVGRRNSTMTVIEKGIVEADSVVTAGGFVLKSKMLESPDGGRITMVNHIIEWSLNNRFIVMLLAIIALWAWVAFAATTIPSGCSS